MLHDIVAISGASSCHFPPLDDAASRYVRVPDSQIDDGLPSLILHIGTLYVLRGSLAVSLTLIWTLTSNCTIPLYR